MNVIRRGVTSSSTSSATRTAANAVANRVTTTGLECEEWIAADVEDSNVAVFSEPLTIDELTSARSSLEAAIAQTQDDRQLAPAGFEGDAPSEAGTSDSSNADAYDPDYQMRMIDHRVAHPGVQEFLDAALIAAKDDGVKNAVISLLTQSSEARASLERAFAANGLSVNLTQMNVQGQPTLPAAAAAIQGHPVEVTDITDEQVEHDQEASLGPLDGFVENIIGTLGALGDNVKSILRSFVARWKRRFDRLFHPGAKNDQDGEGENMSAPSFLIDALTGTAALIVIMALARRVPLMR